MELDVRARAVLNIIVEAYIDGAQAVSSNFVAQSLGELSLSPATVRSIMAELETLRLLHQPHTSAGRVPTEKGIRTYLDGLEPRLRSRDKTRLERAAAQNDWPDFAANLSHILAGMSGQLAVVAVPRFVGSRVQEVGLVRYEARRFVAVFVSPAGLVQQKVVETDFDLAPEDLIEAQNFLNEQLKEHTLPELREIIRTKLEGQRSSYDSLRREALQIGAQALPAPFTREDLEIFVEGTSHLVGQPEFADLEQLRQLLRAIEDRTALLELLDRVLDGSGVKVMLGSEHHIRALPQLTCVGAASDRAAITLLGPSRMNYGRVVPLVGYATELFARYWRQV